MTPEQVPPWGTPDDPHRRLPDHGLPDHGTPDYGTPPSVTDRRGRTASAGPSPAAVAPATGLPRPPAGPDLLGVDTIVVIEQGGFLSTGGYQLRTAGDLPLGSVIHETSVAGLGSGGVASTTYLVLDPAGTVIGSMERPGVPGRSRFLVSDAYDLLVGWVEQTDSPGVPELVLTTTNGRRLLLRGAGSGGRDWTLTDATPDARAVPGPAGPAGPQTLGRISREYAGIAGLIKDTQRFAVHLSPALVGEHRLLAVMATVCLDYVRDARRR